MEGLKNSSRSSVSLPIAHGLNILMREVELIARVSCRQEPSRDELEDLATRYWF